MAALIANTSRVLTMAVENGVMMSRRIADKHANDPLTDAQWDRIEAAVEQSVLDSISHWFDIPFTETE